MPRGNSPCVRALLIVFGLIAASQLSASESPSATRPNVRGVRTDEWKLVRYPHGDSQPDRHKSELYHIACDPDEGVKQLLPDQKIR